MLPHLLTLKTLLLSIGWLTFINSSAHRHGSSMKTLLNGAMQNVGLLNLMSCARDLVLLGNIQIGIRLAGNLSNHLLLKSTNIPTCTLNIIKRNEVAGLLD